MVRYFWHRHRAAPSLPPVSLRDAMAFDDYHEGEDEDVEEEEWTDDHLKLLYMISLYAKCAQTVSDSESWIRKNSVLVLIYEGIVAGACTWRSGRLCQSAVPLGQCGREARGW